MTINTTVAGKAYFVRVDSGSPAGPRGRYGIAVTFDGLLEPGGLTVDQILRGPYDTLGPSDLGDLFEHPDRALYNRDDGGDDSAGGADDLKGVYGPEFSGHFRAVGSLTTATDVDFYRIRSPLGARRGSLTLVARLRAVGPLFLPDAGP